MTETPDEKRRALEAKIQLAFESEIEDFYRNLLSDHPELIGPDDTAAFARFERRCLEQTAEHFGLTIDDTTKIVYHLTHTPDELRDIDESWQRVQERRAAAAERRATENARAVLTAKITAGDKLTDAEREILSRDGELLTLHLKRAEAIQITAHYEELVADRPDDMVTDTRAFSEFVDKCLEQTAARYGITTEKAAAIVYGYADESAEEAEAEAEAGSFSIRFRVSGRCFVRGADAADAKRRFDHLSLVKLVGTAEMDNLEYDDPIVAEMRIPKAGPAVAAAYAEKYDGDLRIFLHQLAEISAILGLPYGPLFDLSAGRFTWPQGVVLHAGPGRRSTLTITANLTEEIVNALSAFCERCEMRARVRINDTREIT